MSPSDGPAVHAPEEPQHPKEPQPQLLLPPRPPPPPIPEATRPSRSSLTVPSDGRTSGSTLMVPGNGRENGRTPSPKPRRRTSFTLEVAGESDSSSGEGDLEWKRTATAREEIKASPSSSTPAMSTHYRKQRHRGRSLRKNVLLRPGSGVVAGVVLPGAVASSGAVPGSGPTTTAIYASTDNEDVESSGEGFAYPARGHSGSIVMVIGRSRQEEIASAADTAYWGWVVLAATWIFFVVGMGSVFGVWEWAWDVGESPWPERNAEEIDEDDEFPIPGYYPAMIILTCIMAWVWVVVAWVGMKYFKHAKIQG